LIKPIREAKRIDTIADEDMPAASEPEPAE
jgi:hypothetical protein